MGDEEPCDFGRGRALEVSGEASAPSKPGEGAFDDPAPWQELEAFDAGRALDDLDGPRSAVGQCIDELPSAIDAVSEDMLQLGKAISHALQQGDCTVDILNVGGMNVDGQQEAVGIGDDVPLAPMNAFARIEAARTAGLCRRSTLAVDDGRCRCRFTAELSPRLSDQSPDDPVPSAGVAPRIKIALHRRVRWELTWQSPPLAAGGQNEQDCLDYLAQINLPRTAQSTSSRQLPSYQTPLRVGHVACIA